MAPSEMDTELPKAQVKRLVKTALQEHSVDSNRDFTMSKDALLAFSESAKLFVHFLTATANDLCRDQKRQTISAKDVFMALEEMDFGELTEPLRQAMDDYKKAKSKSSGSASKAKAGNHAHHQEYSRDHEGGYADDGDEHGVGMGQYTEEDLQEEASPKRMRTSYSDEEYA